MCSWMSTHSWRGGRVSTPRHTYPYPHPVNRMNGRGLWKYYTLYSRKCTYVADLSVSSEVVVSYTDVQVVWYNVASPAGSTLLVRQYVHASLLKNDGSRSATSFSSASWSRKKVQKCSTHFMFTINFKWITLCFDFCQREVGISIIFGLKILTQVLL